MTVVFRCDANSHIGIGHLTRCRALAAALREQGETCIIVGPDLSCRQDSDSDLFCQWIVLPELTDSTVDATKFADIAARYHARAIVLDDMRIDDAYQQVLREAGLYWLQFDGGQGQRVWANQIVNANPQASADYYRKYAMNMNVKLLLGPQHAVIRPEFRALFQGLPPSLSVSAKKRVLIMFGGGDDRGAICFSIKVLHAVLPDNVVFEIVAGRLNPNHNLHYELVANLPSGRAHYHIDPPSLPALMQECALAVMAGGTATYEVNMFGIPMVLIAISENQIVQSRAWDTQGQAIYVGELTLLDPHSLAQAVIRQLNLQSQPAPLVDGLGAMRVAKALISAF